MKTVSIKFVAKPNGMSTIANGEYKGMTLADVVEKLDADLLGRPLASFDKERFPLLVKFIDAYDRLSIQVHPKDDYAKVNENGELEFKTLNGDRLTVNRGNAYIGYFKASNASAGVIK